LFNRKKRPLHVNLRPVAAHTRRREGEGAPNLEPPTGEGQIPINISATGGKTGKNPDEKQKNRSNPIRCAQERRRAPGKRAYESDPTDTNMRKPRVRKKNLCKSAKKASGVARPTEGPQEEGRQLKTQRHPKGKTIKHVIKEKKETHLKF